MYYLRCFFLNYFGGVTPSNLDKMSPKTIWL